MLGPDDVGHRVVVRHLVGVRNGRPLGTDALGVLTSLSSDYLIVTTRTGEVRIARERVIAAKRVPDRPAPPAPRRSRRTDT